MRSIRLMRWLLVVSSREGLRCGQGPLSAPVTFERTTSGFHRFCTGLNVIIDYLLDTGSSIAGQYVRVKRP